MKKYNKYLFIFILIFSSLSGCTKLNEEVYNQLPVDQFGKNEKEINALIGPIYRTFHSVFPGSYMRMVNESSDMAVTPTRKGGDWWDGGQYKELRMFLWTPRTNAIVGSYNACMSNISKCNQIYYMINTSAAIQDKDKVTLLAQIRGVRAFWYYILVDNFGNVPIVTDFLNTEPPTTSPRKDVYKFIISELLDIKDNVRSDVSSASYGKITKGAVFTLLAKMYLNAMVWNPDDGPKWQECVDACDSVMSLPYIIEPNWKINFAVHNEVSREIILPAVYTKNEWGMYIANETLHYLDPIALGLHIGTWNGISAMPGYVKSFDPGDKRIGGSFLIGPMLDPATGDTLITAHGRPLIHTVDITMKYNIDADGWGQTEQEDGARCYKWEFEKGLSGNMENDYAIFRLADVYLMKAEALVRMNKDNAEATSLVNDIRKRAFDDPSKLYSSVTLHDIYMERKFEFAWECMERQDQIRFGTFLDPIPGWKRDVTNEPKYLLFPIPQTAIDANPNLHQNPGY